MVKNNQFLYKYRAFNENTLKIFINKEIYFPAPGELNDPLDCNPQFVAILEQLIKEIPKGSLQKIICSMDFREIAVNLEKLFPKQGVFSLSEKDKEPLLWSHYADGHRGLCIGFDLKYLSGLVKDPTEYDHGIYGSAQMIYSMVPPYKKLFMDAADRLKETLYLGGSMTEIEKRTNKIKDCLIEKIIHESLRYKSEDWTYESEHRLIKKERGLLSIPSETIREIIFGLKTCESDIKTIRNILKDSQWEHVKTKRVKLVPDIFHFDVVPFD